MPIIRKSPWAKLMTFMTPQMRVRPMATSAYTDPIKRLLTICCISWSVIGPPLGNAGRGRGPGGPSRSRRGYFLDFQAGKGQTTSLAADSNGQTVW